VAFAGATGHQFTGTCCLNENVGRIHRLKGECTLNNLNQRRLIPAICLSLFAVSPSFGSSPDAWEEFRKDVEEKCLDAAEKKKLSATYRAVVDPHGSQSYGFAFVEETNTRWGVSWSLCIYDKRAQTAELTSLLMTELIKEFEKAESIASASEAKSANDSQYMPAPDPKGTFVKYSAEEIRGWYFFGEAGGNEFLRIYLSDAMQVFRAQNTGEILGRVNTVSQNDPPEQVLADIEKALKDFVDIVDLIALLGAGAATQNDEYGELYTLYLINRARTQNQTASFKYEVLEKDGFKKASSTASAFHAIGIDPSLVEKWTHVDGREYVYNINSQANPKLIFDGINNGTYNYCTDFVCHMIMDVMPWVLWGATISDTTTPNERAIAFRNAFTALRYVKKTKGDMEKWTSFDF